jgi:metal-responsive CopG/Arc/MetJ family transcriptional regulator
VPTKLARFTINLPEHLAKAVEDLARIDERSISKYLAIVIQQHVDGVLSEPAEQSRSADSQPK